ncbi:MULTISPECIES: SDR family oxidoreductase [unclassified Frankia]|uniref:SDR family NAD(P)-dependent oxidoreductase n=1 Tax=unclassified Frankia TaxID=2632575 RepID=UPI001EF68045|nr:MULTISPECIES: SDR family NAD(P)-dependent oxidoreductase [unclassified Frankia]
MRQEERALVIVGPGRAFGAQLLRRFAREGFALGVIARSADTVGRIEADLASDDVALLGEVADVTEPGAVTAALGTLADALGGLTAVVYNAKLSIRGTALSVPAETVNQTLAVNVTGALTVVQAAAELLADRPSACVLLTAAGPRTEPAAGRLALAIGKAGLLALGTSLAPVLQARGIRLRTVVLEARVAPAGPLVPEAVADHFWNVYAAPRGSVFRLVPPKAPDRAPQLFGDG